jgi:hypothetical protein
MRGDQEIEVPIPRLRRIVAVAVLLLAGTILVGWLPVTEATIGSALLLVAVGLMV